MTSSDHQCHLKPEHITSLLEHACKTNYKAREGVSEDDGILRNCILLFGKDYKYSLLNNSGGELCGHYPSQLVIQEYLRSEGCNSSDNVESIYDMNQLQNLVSQAKSARCRSRFVVPVILYEGKHICRSATIAGGAEMYGRQFYDFFTSGSGAESSNQAAYSDLKMSSPSDMQIFDRIRGQDIRLLKTFNVGFIFDLMLEQKKVKFGMNVTSSEKVDKENRYSEFSIASVPYPGCEFFKEWKSNGYRASGLKFDWKQGFVDTTLDIPFVPSPPRSISWCSYQSWDLVTLTQNYLKLLLHYVAEGDTGLLVHCISGWDRTPLFISLLRLSLWAEGLVNPSLSPLEILYLTIGYDWYLFGHHFPDRLSRGEEVFFFCFTFLQYITGEEFNIGQRKHKKQASSSDVVDSIVLERPVTSKRSSSSSISSSSSSLNSTRSSADPSLQMFFDIEGSVLMDDDPSLFNAMKTSNVTLRAPPKYRCSPQPSATDSASTTLQRTSTGYTDRSSLDFMEGSSMQDGSALMKSSSSPVPVPCSYRRLAAESSRLDSVASCGSWQLISGPESFRFTPSLSGSSHPSQSSDNDSTRNHSQSSSHDAAFRRQRLDEVRHVFVNHYCTVMGSCGGFSTLSDASSPSLSGSGGGGMLTGLLENFAEKDYEPSKSDDRMI